MLDIKEKRHIQIVGKGGGGQASSVEWDDILNKPDFATVATSGDYDDLEDKPTILTQWFGTQAEYDLIDPKDPNTIYNIEGSDNVQADWNQSDSTADDYIKNKPTIPAAQVNADWNSNSGVSQILNKPAMTTETLTFTLQGGSTLMLRVYTKPIPYFYIENMMTGYINTVTLDGSPAEVFDIYTSEDQTNWTLLGNTNDFPLTVTLPENRRTYFKAVTDSWQGVTMTAVGGHNVGGNIMSLLYGDNYRNYTTFPQNTINNFEDLFSGDTMLMNAGELILPATTLTVNCYSSMFDGCSHLETAPALPATTLANGCYQGMFSGCTSLTTAPTLPATTLTEDCYATMFSGCIGLTTAPELPATILAVRCYGAMFNHCTSLNTVITYAQDISAMGCLYYWLDNVAPSGDFYNLGGATYTSGDPSGIPSGWTEHNSL